MGAWRRLRLLIRVSRPVFWVIIPLVYVIGLAYGRYGLSYDGFQVTAPLVLQLFSLSFPFCLFTCGINDIHDRESDQHNPRKKAGLEGGRLKAGNHVFVFRAVLLSGLFVMAAAVCTWNLLNIYYTVILLIFAYAYSAPPARLKARTPLDLVAAGVIAFLAPFALGYSMVDNALTLPLEVYLFTFCVMGIHAFSTIVDYDTDKRVGDNTFAVVWGKRAAALVPAAAFGLTIFFLNETITRAYFGFCIGLFLLVAVFLAPQAARWCLRFIYVGFVTAVAAWILPMMTK